MKNMRLKLARVEMNLSQEELATKVNVTRPTINLLEGGKFNPSLQLCIRICKVLNKTLNDLFWEEDNLRKPPFTVMKGSQIFGTQFMLNFFGV